ncbi:hypothetical protein EZM97_14040 [Dyella soli]|uniref:Lipoprotein n=1 Tax=Dyella soli TaxID=522319 RepID=A0A4V2NLR0_9GAMM|nr:hypothetical protein EZM97_14040 [Dyella soli]
MPTSKRSPRSAAAVWYQQPILWLGAAIFGASLVGCGWMIVLGERHADQPVDAPHAVFGVPSSSHSSHGPRR